MREKLDFLYAQQHIEELQYAWERVLQKLSESGLLSDVGMTIIHSKTYHEVKAQK